ncbi:armadillo repeat-containing protein gudu [Oratosquilla oratoria]|uniref:armadillo repeat-containing protein gudu n=1 Tax=Oratosquilla oratoria TaxID=337810 RepID=UPI003F761E81
MSLGSRAKAVCRRFWLKLCRTPTTYQWYHLTCMKMAIADKSINLNSETLRPTEDELEGEEVGEDEDEDNEEDEEEEDQLYKTDLQSAELSSDYWQIQKLVKYLRVGNATSTIIALVALKDCPLHLHVCQLALNMLGGVEVLLNILKTHHLRCTLGSLQVLEAACGHISIRAAVCSHGGLQVLQDLVSHKDTQVRGLAASVMARVCSLPSARTTVTRANGIPTLVELLKVDPSQSSPEALEAAEGAARALWALSTARSGRAALLNSGALPLLGRLLHSTSPSLLIPVVGTLHQCLAQAVFRERVEQSGYTSSLVRLLQSMTPALQTLAAKAVDRCSVLEATRTRLVREGGLDILVVLMSHGAYDFIVALANRFPLFAREVNLEPEAPLPRKSLHRRSDLCLENKNSPLIFQTFSYPACPLRDYHAGLQRASPAPTVESSSENYFSYTEAGDDKEDPGSSAVADVVAEDQTTTNEEQGEQAEELQDIHLATATTTTLSSVDEVALRRFYSIDKISLCSTKAEKVELLEAVTGAIWHVACTPSHVPPIKRLRAVPVLVALLSHPDERVGGCQYDVIPSETVLTNVVGALGEVATDTECCRVIQKGDGISTLIQLLRRTSDALLLNVTRALGSCAHDNDALDALLEQDGLRLLWSHLKNPNRRVQASAASAICICLQQEKEGLAEVVRSLVGGIELLVALLESGCESVLSAVCAAIARIAQDPQNLAIMTDYGAVTSLSKLAVRIFITGNSNVDAHVHRFTRPACCNISRDLESQRENKGSSTPADSFPIQFLSAGTKAEKVELLEAVTGAIWHVACTPSHVPPIKRLRAVPVLVALLSHPDERVLTNVVGALGEVATDTECCRVIQKGDGISTLIQLLRRTSDALLLNVTRALGSCAHDNDALDALLEQDGLRLLWSHLKNPNRRVQASAASAICICLQQEKEGLAEVVRSLVGGIELLVALLESGCESVLSAVCAAIARIAQDPQNLAIMTDYGAVTSLSKLAVRENDTLRPYLAEAIAACCVSRETGLLFGQAGAVAPLVQYLETDEKKIRRPTCRALHRLSLEPENCVTLHQSGAVPLLLEMLGSEDEVVQEAAADCLRNIRLLALQRCRQGTKSNKSATSSNINDLRVNGIVMKVALPKEGFLLSSVCRKKPDKPFRGQPAEFQDSNFRWQDARPASYLLLLLRLRTNDFDSNILDLRKNISRMFLTFLSPGDFIQLRETPKGFIFEVRYLVSKT